MLREKGCFRMNLSITGKSREDCIAQIQREFGPPPSRTVNKLQAVKLVRDAPGFNGGLLDAKRYVEQELPQLG
jgi:hypothetical protein